MVRRPVVQRRDPVFIGCEGKQEVTLVRWLGLRAEERGLHLHFVGHDLGAAGSPLTKAQQAERWLHDRGRDEPFVHKAIVIDADRLNGLRERQEVAEIALRAGLYLIWQEPCHDAILVRLLGCIAPIPHKEAARRLLNRHWPEYDKGVTARQLDARLDAQALPILQGMPAFSGFLRRLGF